MSDPVVKIVPGPDNPGVVNIVSQPQVQGVIGIVPMQGAPGKDGTTGADLGIYTNNEETISGIENETVIDSFVATEWRSVKYMVTISKILGGENKFYTTEISVLVDNDGINVSEYGSIDNDGEMGTVTISKTGNNVELIVTPNLLIKPVTVRYVRIGLKA